MAVIVFYETTPVDQTHLSRALSGTGHHWLYQPAALSSDTISHDAEVISVAASSSVTSQLMDHMPKLRLIAVRGADTDHIDLDHAADRNITVVNVPHYGSTAVAEHTIMLLLALSRRLDTIRCQVALGNYAPGSTTGFELRGKTIGIIGTGAIGRQVAAIAHGFGMTILACDPAPHHELAARLDARYVSREELLAQSDIISLHAQLTPETYHLINRHTLRLIKHGAILLNTARGALVDNRALINALQSGQLAGAGLDTFEGEHFIHTSSIIANLVQKAAAPESYVHTAEAAALLHMNNVIITPHSAYNTHESLQHINTTTAQNILNFYHNRTLQHVVEPPRSGRLIIVRHGQSEWNALGKWTGTTDVHITPLGAEESRQIGAKLRGIAFDFAYTSQQVRTKETLASILQGAQQPTVASESSAALNERDYGIYTGMRKDDIKRIIGAEPYDQLRRSWDGPVEGGESLKDVYERTIPYYLRIIVPRLRHGQNILVVAHGNSIRSLLKYIENIADEDIGSQEMIQNCALSYTVDAEGRAKHKQVIMLDTTQDIEP